MHIVAIAGNDRRELRKLEQVKVKAPVSLRVFGWTNDIAALMQAARLLVTKPGGLTISEAALCSLPVVFFDPSLVQSSSTPSGWFDAGAAVIAQGPVETASAIVSLLRNGQATEAMVLGSKQMARPHARREIAALALNLFAPVEPATRRMTA